MTLTFEPTWHDGEPPLDTVLLWLSRTIERHLECRRAFPQLRQEHARGHRGAASLYLLTAEEAGAVLADAAAQYRQTTKGLKSSYRALSQQLQMAIAEARRRPHDFSGKFAICSTKTAASETWTGTREQFQALGIEPDGPWPGEPSAPERGTRGTDPRGYQVRITSYSTLWKGLFTAHIAIPPSERAQNDREEATSLSPREARIILQQMPASAAAYRKCLAERTKRSLFDALKRSLSMSQMHGYSIEDESIEEIVKGIYSAVNSITSAKVKFNVRQHSEIAQQCRAAIASADPAFQRKLTALVNSTNAQNEPD